MGDEAKDNEPEEIKVETIKPITHGRTDLLSLVKGVNEVPMLSNNLCNLFELLLERKYNDD